MTEPCEKILEIVRRYCGDDITAETELFEEGRMDSFAVISVLGEMSDNGWDIEITEAGAESFSSVNRLIKTVEEKYFFD